MKSTELQKHGANGLGTAVSRVFEQWPVTVLLATIDVWLESKGKPVEVVNISQTELDPIVERVVRTGEEVIVGKEGTPIAKLIPYRPPHPANRLDVFAGQIQMPEDFEQWPVEEARALGIED